MAEENASPTPPETVLPPTAQTDAEPAPSPAAPGPSRSSSRVKTVLVALLAAAVFGAAGYMMVPQSAQSALTQADKDLRDARSQLQQTQAEQKKLAGEHQQARQELAAATKRIEEFEASGKASQTDLAAAEKSIAEFTSDLAESKKVGEPLRKAADEARQAAAGHLAAATQAKGKLQQVQTELAAVTKTRDEYGSARKRLAGEKTKLERDLGAQKRVAADLKRLLKLLEVGPADAAPPPSGTPGERPITYREMIFAMGQPTLVFQKDRTVSMHWGKDHAASAADGVVTTIDGQPATRTVLASVAEFLPPAATPAAPWRLGTDQPLHYADLVATFGRPEGTAGTGGEFQAWWRIGAWARPATAKVVDGIVTEFDGRKADPAAVCELVRQRGEAYAGSGGAPADARARYDAAVKIVGEQLRRQAVLNERDGWKLKRWEMAPFDSVGTWVAAGSGLPGSTTIRAAVDCTWSGGDGARRIERRYAVVTVLPGPEGLQQVECEIFHPRE